MTCTSKTAERTLAVLAFLGSHPHSTGSELAERFGVSARTIRSDIARLRELGYPIHASLGATGHYRLGRSGTLPPLLLDEVEAVAVAAALSTSVGFAGAKDSIASALLKLEQILPPRTRSRVSAVQRATGRGPENTGSDAADPEIDPAVLSDLALAIDRREHVRFDDVRVGEPEHVPARTVEPYRLINWQRRWYLVARSIPSAEWEAIRVDWIRLRMPTHRSFVPRPMSQDRPRDNLGINEHTGI